MLSHHRGAQKGHGEPQLAAEPETSPSQSERHAAGLKSANRHKYSER